MTKAEETARQRLNTALWEAEEAMNNALFALQDQQDGLEPIELPDLLKRMARANMNLRQIRLSLPVWDRQHAEEMTPAPTTLAGTARVM